ncbi:MAG: HDIG domain-containing protein [Muribaculaceae bacterium]|nr:HDIG domain-containing protein [Muribaculaceae bacterium]
MADYNKIIDKYYPVGSPLRDIYLRHCQGVAEMAVEIVRAKRLPLSEEEVREAAMLHDIGVFMTDAPSIECHGTEPYIRHGILGAELLRREGYPEADARVAERHTGSGLTRAEIEARDLPLPHIDLVPETLLERVVCYADKFYSKSGDMERKSIDEVERSMQRFGDATMQRFLKLKAEFS